MSGSDSFADLWNSTAPSTTKPAVQKQPTTLGAPSTQPKRVPQKQDVFALLSASGSGSTTPATRSRPITPLLSQPTSNAGARQKGASTGGDAFSSLFTGTPLNGTGQGGSMTIAERAAKVEEERRARYAQSQQKVKPVESAWEGLDTLAGRGGAARKTTVAVEDEWGLGLGAATSASTAPPKDDDDWGLGEFGSPATTTSTPATTKPSNAAIWELDEFADSSTSDSLLTTNAAHGEDDILGVLGAPASTTPSPQPQHTPSPPSRSPAPPQRSTPNHSSSPPPHILGQIVEMGFSVQQARVALAATDTGVDVQSALDMLLSNTASTLEQERASPAPAQPRAPRGASARARAREQGEQEREREREGERDTAREQERNLQEQADKLLAQASEIGLSVFNRAGAFWREGREKVQKAYEERVGATPPVDGAQSSKQVPAKPKWMTEAVDLEPDAETHGFSDEVDPAPPTLRKKAQPPRPKKVPSPPPEIDLFSSEPTAYVSPFRRARPSGSTPGPSTPPTHATPRASTPSAPLPPNPPVSQTALLNAQKHRTAGTAHFKLGQHAAAESAYTNAIECLPAGHRALVPLYNNRALARLRTGEHRGAAEDAGCVLALFDTAGVGTRAGPGARRGADGTAVKGGEGDDAWEWSDAMVKALKRRAEALEGRERWSEARADWEVLAGAAWAGERARGEGVRGVGRCRKMAGGEGEADGGPAVIPKSAPKPKPRPRPAAAATTGLAPPSTALKTLRQASNAQEAEDTERARLKDRVDSIILAWKTGKETNIRALLAGLGVVLWPALGVEPCGMHELVSSKQVKVRYMRVIGRLHPDKLNAGNATLEQRMIANAVFGILNEAWNAFKQ